jgi:hypothetical protein
MDVCVVYCRGIDDMRTKGYKGTQWIKRAERNERIPDGVFEIFY